LNYHLLSVIFLNTHKGQNHLLSKQFPITRFKVSSLKLLIERCPRGPLDTDVDSPNLLNSVESFLSLFCYTLHSAPSLSLSLPLYLFAANTSSNLCTSLLLFLQAIHHDKKSTTLHWKISKSLVPF